MTTSWEYLVLQICFAFTATLLNVYFFHILKQHLNNYLWVLLSSLSSAHVVANCGLLSMGVLMVVVQHYFDDVLDLQRFQLCMLLLSVFLVLLHVVSVTIKDLMLVVGRIIPKDNISMIILPWLSTAAVCLMLGLLDDRGISEVAHALCLAVLVVDILLIFIHTLVQRRLRKKQKAGWEGAICVGDNLATTKGIYPSNIGCFLTLTFVALTLPLVVERLVYHRNGSVSTFCVSMTSIMHGMNLIRSSKGGWDLKMPIDV